MPKRCTIASLALTLVATAVANAQSFTPGNLVVIRVGDGSTFDGSARPMSLLEINPTTGSVVTTRPLPSTGGGNLLTNPGPDAVGIAKLARAPDGRFLTFNGYNLAAGSSSAAVGASTVQTIGRIDAGGTLDVSTTFTVPAGSFARGVATSDGTRFYTSASAAAAPGLGTTTLGSSGAATTLDTAAGYSSPQVVNGQLYMVRGLSTLEQTTPALPTSGPVTRTPVVAANTIIARAYVFLDRDATVPGMDTLYIAGDNTSGTANGVQKFSFDGSTWTARGGILGEYISMTAVTNGGSADLFLNTKSLVTGETEANSLQRFTDTAAFNATMTSGTPTTLMSVGTNFALEGIAFAPVPEPASGMLVLAVGMAVAGLGRRCSKRGK